MADSESESTALDIFGSRQCKAMLSNRTRRCQNHAMAFRDVCHKHGGTAPQVERKAEELFWQSRSFAAGFIVKLMHDADHNACRHCGRYKFTEQLKLGLRAALEILNRTGLGPTFSVRSVSEERADVEDWMRWTTPESSAELIELTLRMNAIEAEARRRKAAGLPSYDEMIAERHPEPQDDVIDAEVTG